jgi:predicted ATP-grasp superfamily ATP-dependent carboligase
VPTVPNEPPAGALPVIALGSYVTVLGAIRSLGAEGIRSYCLTEVEPYIAFSRYYHEIPGGEELREPADLPRFLEGFSLPRAVLLPCADDWVLAVARLSPELSRRFPSSAPSVAVLEQFLDKSNLERLLDRFEVQRPQTRTLPARESLGEVDWSAGTSWFLKPVDSQSFRRRFGVKAFRVASLEEAESRWDVIHGEGLDVVLQEYVAGPASNHYFVDGFVDREGEIKALFARRRLRIHPPDFGDSSALVSVPLTEVAPALAACRRLLSGVGFRGIFSVEFKRDANDGAFKLIEVNTRAWANVAFATSCGVNTPLMAYRDALGARVESVNDYVVGRRFCFFPVDFSACLKLHRSGQLSLVQWLRSWINAEPSVFRWSDPLPGVNQALRLGRTALEKLFR